MMCLLPHGGKSVARRGRAGLKVTGQLQQSRDLVQLALTSLVATLAESGRGGNNSELVLVCGCKNNKFLSQNVIETLQMES